MSSRCLAKISLNSMSISSMSFLSSSESCESSHLKLWRNVFRSSSLLFLVEFLDFFQFFDFSENSVLNRGVGSGVSRVVLCGKPKVLIVRWFF